MSITHEDLIKVLTHKNIKILPESELPEEDYFNRNIDFEIEGSIYSIEWWGNICYLHCQGLKMPFTNVEQLGTWPNNYKVNLQFYYTNKDTCAVIGIEKYER
jgi:hypothetical protein